MCHAVFHPRMLGLSLVVAGVLVLGSVRTSKAAAGRTDQVDRPPVLRDGASAPAPALSPAPSSPSEYNSLTGASTVTVTPASRDYGTVKVGQTTSNTFNVANTSSHDLDATVTAGTPFSILSPSGGTLKVPSGTSKTITVGFSPSSVGTFTRSVTFSNPNWSTNVSVTGKGALMPVALFSGTPTNGTAPLVVAFTDSSTGTITNRVWTFGDGSTLSKTAANASHTYASAGSFSVQLAVYGPLGVSTVVKTNYIAVDPPSPALLQVAPDGLDFGSVDTGTTAEASLVVSNAGGSLLTGSLSVAGGPFTLATNAFSVPGYGWTQVAVRFSPPAVGLYTGEVSAYGNGGEAACPLAGEGVSVSAAVSVIRFSAASYAGTEGGKVKVTVLREGGSQGAVSVHYLTRNGTALANADYVPKSGTLSWADGDAAPKVLKLSLLADALVEPKESFKIRLDPPVGAILGTPALAKVGIVSAVAQAGAPLAAAGGAPVPGGPADALARLGAALGGGELAWHTSPQAPWTAGAALSTEGEAGARSGRVGGGQVSWLQTEVDGPGTLEFAWSLAGTEAGAGLFLDNGAVSRRQVAGEGWSRETVAVGKGAHTLEWAYLEGAPGGEGALHLESVSWVPER